jgi:hypothetical protein
MSDLDAGMGGAARSRTDVGRRDSNLFSSAYGIVNTGDTRSVTAQPVRGHSSQRCVSEVCVGCVDLDVSEAVR